VRWTRAVATAFTGVLAAISFAPVTAGAAPTATDETFRLLRVVTTERGAAVDVAVPFSRSGRTEPATAFQVTVADRPATVSADRLIDQPLYVDVVVDPPAAAPATAALQGALAEFLDQLEPNARIRVTTSSTAVDAGQDRAAALAALRDLGTSGAPGFASRLGSVLADDPPADALPVGGARVAVVTATTDPILALGADPTTASLVRGTTMAPSVWARFRAVSVVAPTLEAFDDLARELRSTYRLDVPAARPGDRISVQFATDAGPTMVSDTVPGAAAPSQPLVEPDATTAAPEPTAAPEESVAPETTPAPTGSETAASAATTDDDSSGTGWAVPAIVVGAAALLAAAVVLLVARRRRRGPPSEAAGATATPAPTSTATPRTEVAVVPPPFTEIVLHDAGTPPPFDPAAMRSALAVVSPSAPDPEPMFESETLGAPPGIAASPLFSHAASPVPPPAPVFSSSLNLRSDVRIARATERAERAIAELRTHVERSGDPEHRPLSIAIEAAASGWLENRSTSHDEVVRLLDADRTGADPTAAAYAVGLTALLEAGDRNLWDLALEFAERLGHPHVPRPAGHYGPPGTAASLVEQVAAVVALGESDFVGRLGGIVGRGLLASWPSRAGHLDRVPLIVSPSLAAAAGELGDATLDPTDLIVGLLAVMEDAALRMTRSEQGVAAVCRRYRDEVAQPAGPHRPKFADPSEPIAHRWIMTTPETLASRRNGAERRLVEEIASNPLVTVAAVEEHLHVSADTAASAIAALAQRGWLTPLAGGEGSVRRWIAAEILAQATRPFSPDRSPIDPLTVDLTVTPTRSVEHART